MRVIIESPGEGKSRGQFLAGKEHWDYALMLVVSLTPGVDQLLPDELAESMSLGESG